MPTQGGGEPGPQGAGMPVVDSADDQGGESASSRVRVRSGARRRILRLTGKPRAGSPDFQHGLEAIRAWGGHVGRNLFQRKHLPVTIAILLYTVWFSYLSISLFFGYGQPPFDLSVFNQGLWLLSHFHAPFVTVMGRNLFGDHTSFILLLVAPFYRLVPEPQGILVLQSAAMAAAAIPVYMLAQKYMKNSLIATCLAVAFLLNPALQQGSLDQFHPEAFQVLIISVAIYAALNSRQKLLVVTVVLALLVKEDAAVLVVPLGLWVALRRDRGLGLWIAGSAVAWALFANEVVIPGLLGAGSIYGGRIPFGGPRGLLQTLVRHPGQFVAYIRSGTRPFFVWQLGAMVGWVFLLAPEIAAIGTFVVLELVISNDVYMQQIIYQYTLPLIPVLMLGTVFAISKQRSVRRRNVATAVVVLSALWTCTVWGLAPFSNNHVQGNWYSNSAIGHGVAYVEKGLPPNAVVSAWYPVVSHIDERTQVYVWPTPFSAQDWGLGTNIGARLPVSSQVQFLILPVSLASDQNPDVMAKISGSFQLVRSRGGIGLYRRIGS